MNVRRSLYLIALALMLSLGLRAENALEVKGSILSLDQNSAVMSREGTGGVKKGDRVRVDKIGENDQVKTIRGEVLEVRETDVVVKIATSSLEVGDAARIIGTAPVLEADTLASIPNDKFAEADPIDDSKLDREAAMEAVQGALKEFPDEPRFHVQMGRLLEVTNKPATAILSYERALELEPNYPVALHNLASLRFFGPEELRNLEEARSLYTRAAELEFEDSMPVVGSMSRDGSGGPQDYKAAVHWFQIAAERGNAYSQNALAQCFENSWGVDQDIGKALLWYRSSAELDHAPAMFSLGRVFERGIGVKPNEATAFDWYGRAAEKGHLEALVSVAVCYLEGRGIGRDAELAMELLKEAGEKGSPVALRQMATIYLQGELVKKDYDLAAAYYHKAAEKGDPASQFNLAMLLEKGQGLDKDRDQAISWYQDAARQGHDPSQKRLLKLRVDW